MRRPSACNCHCVRDCLGCSPEQIANPDLPKYVYGSLSDVSWGMPSADSGSLGPYSLWNHTSGARWECPTWFSGVTCGTEFLDQATFEWRLDTVDVAGMNGTKKGVRVDPTANKCNWTWAQGKVLNVYHRGSVIGTKTSGASVVPTSSEPKFSAELYDLVAGSMEGTLVDPGTDGLTGLCSSDPGEEIHSLNDFFTYGNVGWRNSRYRFGISWSVNAAQVSGVWRWILTGSANWAWTWRNTAKYKTGTITGTQGTFSRVGLYAAQTVYGGSGASPTLWRAGVRVPLYPNVSSGMPTIPYCDTYTGPAFGTHPGTLTTVWGEAVTEETVRNLATSPSSTPPGHRLWRGTGGTAIDFHNQFSFQFASNDPIDCARDLFTDYTINMTLLPGISDVDNGYFENSFGLSLPTTCSIHFSNS